MTRTAFDRLLDSARVAHGDRAALARFCPFPDDLAPQTVTPFSTPPAAAVAADTTIAACDDPLARAFVDAAPLAMWRETYKGTDIGQDFHDRFGCYCLIGSGGAWASNKMAAYFVYMPPGMWYPFHHHPAEELYLVLAGGAEFLKSGDKTRFLSAGETAFHASSQPHATRTLDAPLLAYVLWRNEFGIKPVLTRNGDI